MCTESLRSTQSGVANRCRAVSALIHKQMTVSSITFSNTFRSTSEEWRWRAPKQSDEQDQVPSAADFPGVDRAQTPRSWDQVKEDGQDQGSEEVQTKAVRSVQEVERLQAHF